jgi:hypothetical protein
MLGQLLAFHNPLKGSFLREEVKGEPLSPPPLVRPPPAQLQRPRRSAQREGPSLL